MTEKLHICPTCNSQMFRRFNSSIWTCFECEKKKVIVKVNKTPIKQVRVKKTTAKKPKSKNEKQKARDRADQWFSRYIRLKYSFDANYTLVAKCFTCGNIHPIMNLDCGHYINREHISVRFNENNARPQCTYCNRYRSGRHMEFGVALAKEIGAENFDNLRQTAMFTDNDNEIFFREQADLYRSKVNEIIKNRNIINPWK